MNRLPPLTHPLILGFDAMDKTLERLTKTNDGYPPYNIERFLAGVTTQEKLRLTLAVAGFSEGELEITTVDRQLIIRGKQQDQEQRDFLYRGIAARQFQRIFVLSDGMEVSGAKLKNGLLSIDLIRPETADIVKKINISVSN